MKKILDRASTVLLLLIFVLGGAAVLIPSGIRIKNEYIRSKVAENIVYSASQMTQDERDQELSVCQLYNQKLYDKQKGDSPDEDYSILETYEQRLYTLYGMATIEIPSLGIKMPVDYGTDDYTLLKGAGHMRSSSLPIGGETTHAVITAHNGDPHTLSFSEIDQLEVGDLFFVTANGTTLTYKVDQMEIVTPDDISRIQIEEGKDYVSLITCYPRNVNSHRLIVRGERTADVSLDSVDTAMSSPMKYFIMAVLIILVFLVLLILIFTMKRKKKKRLEALQTKKAEVPEEQAETEENEEEKKE